MSTEGTESLMGGEESESKMLLDRFCTAVRAFSEAEARRTEKLLDISVRYADHSEDCGMRIIDEEIAAMPVHGLVIQIREKELASLTARKVRITLLPDTVAHHNNPILDRWPGHGRAATTDETQAEGTIIDYCLAEGAILLATGDDSTRYVQITGDNYEPLVDLTVLE